MTRIPLVVLLAACTGADRTVATPPPLPGPPSDTDVVADADADADTDADADSDTDVDSDTDADSDADTDADSDTDTDDSDSDAGPDTDLWSTLHGQVPVTALPPPTFVVTNFDGTSRDQDALLGHVTVMWFLPAAATGG